MVKQGEIFRCDYGREPVHGNGASDVHTHMVGIKVFSNPIRRTHIAGIACMDIGHLHYPDTIERRMVALRLYPLQGCVLDVLREYLSRGVLSFDYHIFTHLIYH